MKRINIFLNEKGKEKVVVSSNERKMLLTLGFHISRAHFGTTVREICIVQGN